MLLLFARNVDVLTLCAGGDNSLSLPLLSPTSFAGVETLKGAWCSGFKVSGVEGEVDGACFRNSWSVVGGGGGFAKSAGFLRRTADGIHV